MDYKSKYLKYKQKYIDLKNNKYGGEHIYIKNIKKNGNWTNINKTYTGKIDGDIIIDSHIEKKIVKDGIWNGNWNPEKNHYTGLFTDIDNNSQQVDIIGKWQGSPNFDEVFYGICENKKPKKKPKNLEELDDIHFKENEKYSLNSFIALNNLKTHDFFKKFKLGEYDNDYWTIKRLNYFDNQNDNFNKLKTKLKPIIKNQDEMGNEIPFSDAEFDDIVYTQVISSIFCYFEFYRLQYGPHLLIDQIFYKYFISNDVSFYDIFKKLEETYIYLVYDEKKGHVGNLKPDNADELLKKKIYIIYIDDVGKYYMLDNYNDIVKYNIFVNQLN